VPAYCEFAASAVSLAEAGLAAGGVGFASGAGAGAGALAAVLSSRRALAAAEPAVPELAGAELFADDLWACDFDAASEATLPPSAVALALSFDEPLPLVEATGTAEAEGGGAKGCEPSPGPAGAGATGCVAPGFG
jgi:hypothetical protein